MPSQFKSVSDAQAWARRKGITGLCAVIAIDGQTVLAVQRADHAERTASDNPGSRVVPLDSLPLPQPHKDESMQALAAALERIHVVQLFAAARAIEFPVGRNGSHNKQSLIVALCEAGKAQAVLDWVGQAGSAPKPAMPAPAPSGAPLSALEQAIRDIAGRALDTAQVTAIATECANDAIALAVEAGLIGSSGPSYIQINLPSGDVKTLERRTHYQFPRLLRRVAARHNVLLVGPAGSGKTTVAADCAEALGLPFYAISAIGFAHDLLGYMGATGGYVSTAFRKAYQDGGIFLLDDCFGSSPDALLALNMALANGECGFPDAMVSRHPNFICIIGDNSDGSGASMAYAGRNRQDGAFLDRFSNIQWEIDADIEQEMSGGNLAWLHAVRAVREFAKGRGVQDVCATPRAVIRGAQALAAGEPADEVLQGELYRGALRDCWDLIVALPAVRQFLEANAKGF